MRSDELAFMPASDLAALIRNQQVSPVEAVGAVLDRIAHLNPQLNAFCAVTADAARAEAPAAEAAVLRGDRLGPLHGVPFSVKDLVITRGVRTGFGSRIFADNIPTEDAPVVERLKAAGGIMVGKTTTPEFGWKGTTDSPLTGISRNPWDPTKSPGGSSGGAAAAVAAGLAPLAVGTDGGGSIRIPGSFCGIFGLKPTCGVVPIYPMPNTGTLSHVGPMTRTVRDAALMLSVMAGPDDRDPLSFPTTGTDFTEGLETGIRGLRVAWSPTLGYARVHPEVLAATTARGTALRRPGMSGGRGGAGLRRSRRDLGAALLWGHRRPPAGVPARLGGSPRSGIGLGDRGGRPHFAAEFVRATLARAAFWQEVRKFFLRYDLLLTPTLASLPFTAGEEKPADAPTGSRLAWVAFTYPFNLTGQPAATVPCGFTPAGLPVGLQIVGKRLADATVLRAAATFEAAAPWAGRRPAV